MFIQLTDVLWQCGVDI